MALWKVDIEKSEFGEFWSNVYIVEAADIETAKGLGLDIVQNERAITNNQVEFTKMRVSDTIPGSEIFSTVVLGLQGNRANATALLPLFNVLRVDFSAVQGRPSRKYLRGVLCESDVVGPNIEATSLAEFQIAYADTMLGMAEYVDVDGEQFSAAACLRPVGMRQLRRGSRRNPIIP